jgi:hypothetical protein
LITLVAFGCGGAGYDFGDKAAAPAARNLAQESSSGSAGEKPLPSADALQRKIIYTAEIELVVEKFNSIPSGQFHCHRLAGPSPQRALGDPGAGRAL